MEKYRQGATTHLTVYDFPDERVFRNTVKNTVKNWRLQAIDGESKNE
jgi:hypothetical protein